MTKISNRYVLYKITYFVDLMTVTFNQYFIIHVYRLQTPLHNVLSNNFIAWKTFFTRDNGVYIHGDAIPTM